MKKHFQFASLVLLGTLAIVGTACTCAKPKPTPPPEVKAAPPAPTPVPVKQEEFKPAPVEKPVVDAFLKSAPDGGAKIIELLKKL